MRSELSKKLEKLKEDELKEIDKIKEKYALKRGELRKQCLHKYDNGDSSLEIAGHPWHTGWDKCSICGIYIETNEYGRGKYIQVVYQGDMGHFDGLTKGKTYIVLRQTDVKYVVKNDFDSISTIDKEKFKVLT